MLHLYAAARLETLAAELADVCSTVPADPMSPEWVAVPSEGMRRWLSLELARHLGANGPRAGDGVAANLESAYPGSLRLRVLEAGRSPEDPDPWRVERLAWSVLAVAEQHADDPVLAALLDLPPGGSRYGRVRRVAELFDRYHVHRPDMIRWWSAGQDLDGTGRELHPHHRWQPHLWRLVRAQLGAPSPPERLPGLLHQLRAGTLPLDLPDRLLLFGLTMLPGGAGFLDLANAVAATRDVHVFLLEPSPQIAATLSAKLGPRPATGYRFRADDASASLVTHPLLRSWGRLHRETAELLVDAERDDGLPAVVHLPERSGRRRNSTANNGPAAGRDTTLLGRLHHDLRHDSAPTGDLVPDPDDRSVQFHACHGSTRQVEVLRDAILHVLADEELAVSEDDILVVCPALERFAPTIEAVFGASADSGATAVGSHVPALRYRIADRSVRSANPVLTATAALLELVAGRFEAPAVLDFVALAPVRARYRLSDDELAKLNEWSAGLQVRWGLDPAHRREFGVPSSIELNTWQAATDRLLLGAAIHDDDLSLAIGDVAPHGIESDDVVTAGRLADLLWRLGDLAEQATVARPVGDWVELLRDAASQLFATPRDAEWQLEALQRVLGDLDELSHGADGPSTTPIEFVDLRRLLADRLDGTPGRPDFFRGGITISSMTPLRWVPHRVVALVGMDQAAFGAGAADGDDLTAALPLLGDRDARGEARQALLETVLSAQDRLVVVRDGHDVRTNQQVPPAVVVAELRDALLGTVAPEVRDQVAARLEVQHPRQPFDERNFVPAALHGDGPWAFDDAALAGAQARRERAALPAPFLLHRLEPDPSPVIDLADLQSFLKHPVKHFLERRLGIRLPRREDGASSLLPVGPNALEKWQMGDRLLGTLLDGGTLDDWARIETRLGTLPPAVLGDALVDDLYETVRQLVDAAGTRGLRAGPAQPLPVDVTLPDGCRVVGAVAGRLQDATPGPVLVTYSVGKPAHRLAAWLDLVALAASDPEPEWRAVGVSRNSAKGAKTRSDVFDLEMTPDASAVDALAVAVDLYRRGSREPLPLFSRLSPKLHERKASRSDWFGERSRGGADGDDAANALVFGGHDLATLRRLPALDDDPAHPHGDETVGGRAERYANYLWHAVESSVRERTGAAEPDGSGTRADGEDAA
ncbi:MAG: exodeoxyribonuclease V subunit gamma [Microthrixaceae bacterium]